ncbi:MAG: hypothetical protein WCG99_04150 [Candidatus Berkelbacteria bacterium]
MTTLVDQIEQGGFDYKLVSDDPPQIQLPGFSVLISLSDEQWEDLKKREGNAIDQHFPRSRGLN